MDPGHTHLDTVPVRAGVLQPPGLPPVRVRSPAGTHDLHSVPVRAAHFPARHRPLIPLHLPGGVLAATLQRIQRDKRHPGKTGLVEHAHKKLSEASITNENPLQDGLQEQQDKQPGHVHERVK